MVEVVAHSRLEPLEVCGEAGVCAVSPAPTWNVTFPRPKPPVRVPTTPEPTSRRKYILHWTDVHFVKEVHVAPARGGGELHLPWLMAADGASAGGQHVRGLFSTDRRHQDPEYTAGLEADCGDPICCRPPHGPATRRAAGPFGDYYCDAPRGLLEDMLDFISQRGGLPAIDYVFWTGDITPDDVWASTRASYEAIMEEQVRSPT